MYHTEIEKFLKIIKGIFIYRGLLENAGIMMGQRTLKINMKKIYPGLYMRIGPTIGGNTAQLGIVEFIMDQNRSDRIYQPESTGKNNMKNFRLFYDKYL